MPRDRKKLVAAFGRALREARLAAGLSQEGLAHQAGMDRTFVSMLERGIRQPSLTTLFELSQALGVEPSNVIQAVEQRLRRPS